MEPWQERVIEEQAALKERLKKLNTFLDDSVKVESIRRVDHSLLKRQRAAMTEYLTVLDIRILWFNPENIQDSV